MARGENVCYYTNGNGHWIRREWQRQCSAKVFAQDRCQGVKGHKGVHWCYSPSGDFEWMDNDDEERYDWSGESVPPGHEDYVSPSKMQKRYFLNHSTITEVTDKAVIAILEEDKTPEKGASIDRPVRPKRRLKQE